MVQILNGSSLVGVFAKAFYSTRVKLSTVAGGERTLTLEEVSAHDSRDDCWIVVYDRVYDVTDFLDEHPGGSYVLLEYAGRDASCAFRGSSHSTLAIKSLSKFLIGDLPDHQTIFRKIGGFHLSGIPE